MDSFGEFLRRERELRHIELNEISKITKIKKAYLQAIENDTYEELPDIAFVKGFIRAYCNYIGLDSEQTINYFQQFYQETFNQAKQPPKKSFKIRSNQKKIIVPAVIGLVLAGIIFTVIYHVSKGRNNKQESGFQNNVPKPGLTPTVETSPGMQNAAVVTETALSGSTETGTAITETALPHTLLLKATENTWVRLVANNDEATGQEALLKPGERILWKFTGTAMLTVGNAEGLTIVLDTKKIHHTRIKAEVIRLRLSK